METENRLRYARLRWGGRAGAGPPGACRGLAETPPSPLARPGRRPPPRIRTPRVRARLLGEEPVPSAWVRRDCECARAWGSARGWV